MNNDHWQKRIPTLNILRGFAALGIVVWHWQNFAFKGNSLPDNFENTSLPLYSFLKIFYEKGFLCVDCFFILSGFIFFWLYKSSIENRVIDFGNFSVKRIARLYPLHVFTLLIIAILQMFYISRTGNSYIYPNNDILHFLLNLFCVHYWPDLKFSFNGPSWALSYEIICYLLFFILVFIRQGSALFCLCVSLITFTMSYSFYINDKMMLYSLSCFFLGGVVFKSTFLISTKYQKLKPVIHFTAATSCLILIIHFYFLNFNGFIMKIGFIAMLIKKLFFHYILLFSTISSLSMVEINKLKYLKFAEWIGNISYSMFLLHFPLQLVIKIAIVLGLFKFDFHNILDMVIFFATLIALSHISFTYFEEPIRNMIINRYKSLKRC
jgi:peptidoglycan/LPS O-acetylase OafA/YrhL